MPDDLKGLKMRTMENPIHIQAYKQFGILPTPMAFTEVLHRAAAGHRRRPGESAVGHHAAKLDQVQKNLTLTGHVYSPALILMNKAQWDKLSAADKQAFLDAAKEAVKANRARIDEDERKAVADLRAKGMLVVENVDKAKFQAALTPRLRRLRQALRPGQHRPDQELQVARVAASRAGDRRPARSAVAEQRPAAAC